MRKTLVIPAVLLVLGLGTVSSAFAGPVSLEFSDATNDKASTVRILITKPKRDGGGTALLKDIPIPAKTNAKDKRDLIFNNIPPGFTIKKTDPDNGKPGLTFTALAEGTTVKFDSGSTGEHLDPVTAQAALGGSFGFQGTAFASTDAFGNASAFTGGIVTDVGELSFTMLASSLPALDGATITQSLFALLNPMASAFGATITNGGDFLDFVFDPTKTTGFSGVVFGTTALSAGAFGSVTVGDTVPEPATLLLLGSSLSALGLRMRRRLVRAQNALISIGPEGH